jgi:hypothetical protein
LAIALVVLTFPTFLWKELEFTGVPLHLATLILALLLAERGRWLGFTLVWIVAIANRQSALLWAVLPGLECLRGCSTPPGRAAREWRAPLMSLAAGVGIFALLTKTMNVTHAQSLVTANLVGRFDRARLVPYTTLAAGVFCVAAGLIRLAAPPGTAAPAIARSQGWLMRILPILLCGVLLVFGLVRLLGMEHRGFYDPMHRAYFRLLVVVAIAGWLRPGIGFDWRMAACAGAALAFLFLREELWDYYLLDIVFFGLAASVPAAETEPPVPSRPGGKIRWHRLRLVVLSGVLLALFTFHVRAAYRIKLAIDSVTTIDQLAERALRAGAIQVSEIGFTNLGYMGWHLNPYFVAVGAKEDARQIGFVRYLGGTRRLWVEAHRVSGLDNGATPTDSSVMASGMFSDLWIYRDASVLRAGSAAAPTLARPIDPRLYSPQWLPLTNAEWKMLIERKQIKG